MSDMNVEVRCAYPSLRAEGESMHCRWGDVAGGAYFLTVNLPSCQPN
jgi:hypothetical protein